MAGVRLAFRKSDFAPMKSGMGLQKPEKRAMTYYRNRTKRATWNVVKSDLKQRKEDSKSWRIQKLPRRAERLRYAPCRPLTRQAAEKTA